MGLTIKSSYTEFQANPQLVKLSPSCIYKVFPFVYEVFSAFLAPNGFVFRPTFTTPACTAAPGRASRRCAGLLLTPFMK